MTFGLIRELLNSCFLAKKITEMMPMLPENLKPRHIHIITKIAECGNEKQVVRVKDISDDLNVTMPSITKLVSELESMQIIEKYQIPQDKRATALMLTALGKEYYQTYVVEYHSRLLLEFSELDTKEAMAMIDTTKRLHKGIAKVAGEFDAGKN